MTIEIKRGNRSIGHGLSARMTQAACNVTATHQDHTNMMPPRQALVLRIEFKTPCWLLLLLAAVLPPAGASSKAVAVSGK
jgi:hypothetical protein